MVRWLHDGLNLLRVRTFKVLIAQLQIKVRWTFIVDADVGEKGAKLLDISITGRFVTNHDTRRLPIETRDNSIPRIDLLHPALLASTEYSWSTVT